MAGVGAWAAGVVAGSALWALMSMSYSGGSASWSEVAGPMASASILVVFAMALAGWAATSRVGRARERPHLQISTRRHASRLAAYLLVPVLVPLSSWSLTVITLASWLRPRSDLTGGNVAYMAGTLALCTLASLTGAAVGTRRTTAAWGAGTAVGTLAFAWTMALPSGGWAAAFSPTHAEFLTVMAPARPLWAAGKLLTLVSLSVLAAGIGSASWLPRPFRRRWIRWASAMTVLLLVPALVLVGANGTRLQAKRPPEYRCAGAPRICLDVANEDELAELADAFAAMAARSGHTLLTPDQTLFQQPPYMFQTQADHELFDYSGTAAKFRLPGWSTADYTVLGYLDRLTWQSAECGSFEAGDIRDAVAQWLASGFDGPQFEASPAAKRYRSVPTATAAAWFASVKDAWLDCELTPADLPATP
jgi:hypothetical protein